MRLPSVTQVLAPFAKFDRIPADVLENASRRGTEVHRICAALALGLWVPAVPEDCAGFVQSFRLWLPFVNDVVLSEVELRDERLGFMGHPDLICRMRGDTTLCLPDLKTPASKTPSWRLQLAAYKHLAQVNGYEVKRVFSLRLNRDGGMPKIDEYTDTHAQDMAIFTAALTAWKFFNQGAWQ